MRPGGHVEFRFDKFCRVPIKAMYNLCYLNKHWDQKDLIESKRFFNFTIKSAQWDPIFHQVVTSTTKFQYQIFVPEKEFTIINSNCWINIIYDKTVSKMKEDLFTWCPFLILDLTRATWRVSCRKQRLLTLPEHLSLPPVFWWGPCCSFVFSF